MGWAQQMNNSFCQHFCLGESCPSGSCPKPRQFSSTLVLFKVLPQGWRSEWVSLSVSKSMNGPCNSRRPPSHSVSDYNLHWFHSRSYWDFFPAMELWAGRLVWGWKCSFLRGTSTAEISFPFLTTKFRHGRSPFHVSAPPTSLHLTSSVCP